MYQSNVCVYMYNIYIYTHPYIYAHIYIQKGEKGRQDRVWFITALTLFNPGSQLHLGSCQATTT